MTGFDKIITHIKTESDNECKEIARNTAIECERVRSVHAKKEQDEYWERVNEGTKKTELRLEQLNSLAKREANRMLDEAKQEMFEEVIALAAKKLSALPPRKYNALLARLDFEPGCKPAALLDKFKDELAPLVFSALFD